MVFFFLFPLFNFFIKAKGKKIVLDWLLLPLGEISAFSPKKDLSLGLEGGRIQVEISI